MSGDDVWRILLTLAGLLGALSPVIFFAGVKLTKIEGAIEAGNATQSAALKASESRTISEIHGVGERVSRVEARQDTAATEAANLRAEWRATQQFLTRHEDDRWSGHTPIRTRTIRERGDDEG
jgi:hypothetical protein